MRHRALPSLVLASLALLGALVVSPQAAAPISVTAANPPSGEQDTAALVVKIIGKNFEPGARANFFKSGTNDPDGIAVRNTTFVSSTEVDAIIDIAPTASLSTFDVKVTLTSGRSGKGSDLFKVVQKTQACTSEPLDTTKFELVGALNYVTGSGAPAYGPYLGVSSAMALATLTLPDASVRSVLVAAVGTPRTTSKMEIFVLDSATGALLDGTALCPTCAAQSHVELSVPNGGGTMRMSAGDVNADGIPDFVVLDADGNASAFVGSLSSNGQIQYSALYVSGPPNNGDIAIGDLDGISGDEVAISNRASSGGKNVPPATVHLYKIAAGTATIYQSLVPTTTPAMTSGDLYGFSVAIGDVTNDGKPDLIVGAPQRDVNGVTDSGAVFVHQGVGAAPPYTLSTTPLTMASAQPGAVATGDKLALGNVNGVGSIDVVSLSRVASDGDVYPGPVVNNEVSDPGWAFSPRSGLAAGWGTYDPAVGDLNGDGIADIVVGAPDARPSSSCPDQGMVYVYLGLPTGGWRRLTIQKTAETDNTQLGYSVAVANGYPFVLATDNFANVGNTVSAGQAYLYRVK